MPSNPSHKFRFQDLEIWQEAVQLGGVLERLADQLQAQKHFRHWTGDRGQGTGDRGRGTGDGN